MASEFTEIRETIGIPCTWTVKGFPRPTYVLRVGKDEAIVMVLTKRWFWHRDASVEWSGFSGELRCETVWTVPLPKWAFLEPFFDLIVPSRETRVSIWRNGVPVAVAEWNKLTVPRRFDVTTDCGTYPMSVSRCRLTVDDYAGDLIECDCQDNGLVVHRWKSDIEPLVALSFWWRFHGAGCG